MYDHMRRTFAEIADVAGIVFEDAMPVSPPPPGSAIHEVGGARMGRDRGSSVVDPCNRTWDVPNLYVCDGSAFVTLPCQNPTLTMLALTARACEDVARAWNSGRVGAT
jgi:choline dehydrogenase-like flavoprotein